MLAAVRQVGLAGYLNTSYPKGLVRRSLDDRPERYAVIDVGTNSVKFHVAERDGDGRPAPVVDRAEVTPARRGIDGDRRDRARAAIERTVDRDHRHGRGGEARRRGRDRRRRHGRAADRRATRGDVLAAVKAATGVAIDVISGEEESRLAYLAAVAGLGSGDGTSVVFDTGGGSSQFTFGQGARVDERFSVDVGAVRYTDQFGLDRAVGRDGRGRGAGGDRRRPVAARRSPEAGRRSSGWAARVTNITAVKHALATYDPDVVHGTVLDLAEIDRQIELYRTRDADGRREIVGLQPKRAEVILAGACIVRTIMDEARAAVDDRERSRSPSRRARRAFRRRHVAVVRPSRTTCQGGPSRATHPEAGAAPVGRPARQLLELVKGADSVELKLTVPSSSHRATIQGLPHRSGRGRAAPGLLLRHARTSISTRPGSSSARGGSRAAAATRSSSCGRSCPNELPDEVRRSASFNVEVDAMPGRLRRLRRR